MSVFEKHEPLGTLGLHGTISKHIDRGMSCKAPDNQPPKVGISYKKNALVLFVVPKVKSLCIFVLTGGSPTKLTSCPRVQVVIRPFLGTGILNNYQTLNPKPKPWDIP